MANYWDNPVSFLFKSQNKTPAIVAQLNKAGIISIGDLLWHIPNKIEQVPVPSSISNAVAGEIFQGIGEVTNFQSRPLFGRRGKGRGPLLSQVNIWVRDHSAEILLTWFNCYPSLRDKLKKISCLSFVGVPQFFGPRLQISNPEYREGSDALYPNGTKRSVYPSIQGVSNDKVRQILTKIPDIYWEHIPDIIPDNIIETRGLLKLKEAWKIIHSKDIEQKEDLQQALKRIKYEELAQTHLKIFARKKAISQTKAPVFKFTNQELESFLELFPYKLTEGQINCLDAIKNDFLVGHPMNRLIQGDVGSGKTTVALLAGSIAYLNGFQTALMCPTESLAIQHYNTAKEIFKTSSLKFGLLIGSTSTKEKKIILQNLLENNIHIIIGTHSLIQPTVRFFRLGLGIIDEQHRFGVEQRLQLLKKGNGTHGLLMSATPIPRSLELTQFGDLEISSIRQPPSGRKGTSTRIITVDLWPKFLSFIKTRLEMKEQIYIVVPAIEDNPELDILALEIVEKKIKDFFHPFSQASLHGKMTSQDKAKILEEFQLGHIQILVATSVIEVGINVINATVMAIFNPERFGLSSLHQLRGRVGRGNLPGFCFLVLDKVISPESLTRLEIIEKTNDGFLIAEEDLKIRGGGNLFGIGQSGHVSEYKIANPIQDQELLIQTKSDVETLLAEKSPVVVEKLNQFLSNQIVISSM